MTRAVEITVPPGTRVTQSPEAPAGCVVLTLRAGRARLDYHVTVDLVRRTYAIGWRTPPRQLMSAGPDLRALIDAALSRLRDTIGP